jgi:hypothetical protein
MARVFAVALLAAALAMSVSLAQAHGDRREAKPLPGLPAWTAGYRSWSRINRAPIPPRPNDAHTGTKHVYASKRIRGGRYPYGTVIVKEITRPGSAFVGVVAAMRKVRGASPRNRDWVMIEWERGSSRSRFGLLAQGAVCYGCHVGAKANDYVFTRR